MIPSPKAGVRHVGLHHARHTAARLLLTENVHPRVVMELPGHSQMRTSMNIYSRAVMPARAREAADRMGALLLTVRGSHIATTEAVNSGRDQEGPAQMGGPGGVSVPTQVTRSSNCSQPGDHCHMMTESA